MPRPAARRATSCSKTIWCASCWTRPSHPSDLAPTGGSIIDLAPTAIGLRAIRSTRSTRRPACSRATPSTTTAIASTSGDPADMFVAVVFRGHLEADSRVTVVTRYELRPCEPGVRVRTDLYNGAADPNTLYLADGLFWGDNAAGAVRSRRRARFPRAEAGSARRRERLARVAVRRGALAGDRPTRRTRSFPAIAPQSAGFNDPTLTAAGVPLDHDAARRRHSLRALHHRGAGPGPGAGGRRGAARPRDASRRSGAGDRHGPGRRRGNADRRPARAGPPRCCSTSPRFGPDPDDPARRTPWSEAVPGRDGRFSVALPADRTYRVQPYAFGLPRRRRRRRSSSGATTSVDIGDITLTASAHLTATVVTAPGQTDAGTMTYARAGGRPGRARSGAEPPASTGCSRAAIRCSARRTAARPPATAR